MTPALAARKHISLEREDDTTQNENKIKSIADESLKQLSTQEELKVLCTFYLLNHLAVKAPGSDFTLKHRWAQKYIYFKNHSSGFYSLVPAKVIHLASV